MIFFCVGTRTSNMDVVVTDDDDDGDDVSNYTVSKVWARPYLSYLICPVCLILGLMPWYGWSKKYHNPGLVEARAGLLAASLGAFVGWCAEFAVGVDMGDYDDGRWWIAVLLFALHLAPFLLALLLKRPALCVVGTFNALNIGAIVALGIGVGACVLYFAILHEWPYDQSSTFVDSVLAFIPDKINLMPRLEASCHKIEFIAWSVGTSPSGTEAFRKDS